MQTPVNNFDGGLNLADSLYELEDGDSPDCLNVTLDELGGVVKRLGMTNLKGDAPFIGVPRGADWSVTLNAFILQAGAKLYKSADGVNWNNFATLTSSGKVAVCDFNGKLVVVHPADGVFTYDGTTWTSVNATVKGSAIAVWQNKVFVASDTSTRVWWSNKGDATTWTTASDFVDLREKDDAPLTAIGLGRGMDVAGRPGLAVFKEDSAYRINNSGTGSFTTLDGDAGAAGPRCITSRLGRICVMNRKGLWLAPIDSLSGFERISRKIDPYFLSTQSNLSKLSDGCAGVHRDRMLFSFPFGAGQAQNNRTLELHPVLGWIVPHDFGAASFISKPQTSKTWHAPANSAAKFSETFVTGADDGSAIAARYQTKWFELEGRITANQRAGGLLAALDRIRATVRCGDAQATLTVLKDYQQAGGDVYPLAQLLSATSYQEAQDFQSLGHAKAFSFRINHSGTASTTTSRVGDGAALEVGITALYQLLLDSRLLQR